MANKDLFKQAIADAKSIREAAIANAKAALEESITPELKELLAQRLQEMEEEVEEEVIAEEEVSVEETIEETIEEVEEVVNEEDEEEAEDDSEESEDEADEEEDAEGEEPAGDEEIADSDMTVDDLKDMIRDILSQEMGDHEEEDAMEDDMEADVEADDMASADMTAADDEEINLEELMAELAEMAKDEEVVTEEETTEEEVVAEENHMEEGDMEEGEHMEEGEVVGEGFVDMLASFQEWLSYAPTKGMFRGSDMTNLQSLLTMLGAMGGVGLGMIRASMKDAKDAQAKKNAAALEDAVKAVASGTDAKKAAEDLKAKADAAIARSKELTGAMEEGDMEEEHTHEGDLHEALATIETLQKELNETNLLNAKLLYVNKVFKTNNLNESQKANVIAAFDKAETVKEVKLVFETVSENIPSGEKKEVVKEAKGFASAAVGVSDKPEVITEANAAVLRMQKLAGIIK